MTARTEARSPLETAWAVIPPGSDHAGDLGSFTRARVERIIAVVAAVGCLALGGQAAVAAFSPEAEAAGWHPTLDLIVFVPLALMVLACVVGRAHRLFAGIFAVVFTLSIGLWPVAAAGVPASPTEQPWMFFLLNVGTFACVLAFPLSMQVFGTVLIPLLWALSRLVQAEFAPGYVLPLALDVSFALILGGIMLALVWVFRSVAVHVDEVRTDAVGSYAEAAAVEAVEKERVAVGALMHDSVLAALIAAERADSDRERELAVAMSREALTRLANAERDAGMGSDAPVPVERVAAQIEQSAAERGVSLAVGGIRPPAATLPGVVARAIALAATQAVANAIDHADARGLDVTVDCLEGPLRVTVVVNDTGGGFDPAAVPADRLGIRASIQARMMAVGGRARVDSGASGTAVRLSWSEGD